MRRDSNAGKGRELDQRDELRAALAGMPVPRGQGRLAGIFPVRRVEQFGSGLCNTGTYCADADDLRISTMDSGVAAPGRAGRLYNAMNFGRHWQGCLCREARDGLQGLSGELG